MTCYPPPFPFRLGTWISTIVWLFWAVEKMSGAHCRYCGVARNKFSSPTNVSNQQMGVTSNNSTSLSSQNTCLDCLQQQLHQGWRFGLALTNHVTHDLLPLASGWSRLQTSSMSAGLRLSASARLTGVRNLPTKSTHRPSNWVQVRRVSKCLGPSAVAVIKGKLMSVR